MGTPCSCPSDKTRGLSFLQTCLICGHAAETVQNPSLLLLNASLGPGTQPCRKEHRKMDFWVCLMVDRQKPACSNLGHFPYERFAVQAPYGQFVCRFWCVGDTIPVY